MSNNERELFDYLTSAEGTSSEVDFLAFAVFAFERREWMAQFEKRYEKPATQEDIDRWVSELSEYQFAQMGSNAIGMFDAAAREYLKDDIEKARREGMEAAIVSKVKAA